MTDIQKLIKYMRITNKLISWKFGKVTTVIERNHEKIKVVIYEDKQCIASSSFEDDISILNVASYVSNHTICNYNSDDSTVNWSDAVLNRFLQIVNLPEDYQYKADWLIGQYTDGVTYPLVTRIQEIVGDYGMPGIRGAYTIKDDKKVYDFYRDNCDAETLDAAMLQMREARTALVKLSTNLIIKKD